MGTDPGMFCKRCYANLDQALDSRCLRCGREFSAHDAGTYLTRPFPSRGKLILHTALMLLLSTIVSVVVAGCLGLAQLKYIHSGH